MKKVFFINRNERIPQCVPYEDEISIYVNGTKRILDCTKDSIKEGFAVLNGYISGELLKEDDTRLPIIDTLYMIREIKNEEEEAVMLELVKEYLIDTEHRNRKAIMDLMTEVYGAFSYGDDGILAS